MFISVSAVRCDRYHTSAALQQVVAHSEYCCSVEKNWACVGYWIACINIKMLHSSVYCEFFQQN